MAEAMPALRIIAQPKALYRARYICEGQPRRNRAQRFVRADDNPYQYVYPTVEIPNEWINQLQQLVYIRLTHVTVPNEQVDVTCVHPYPIDTDDCNVLKNPLTNTLYFPVSDEEFHSGRKSFQFTLYKLTQYQLKTNGALRILNSEERDEQRLEDPADPKQMIETYQLGQSQLIFSIAVFQNNQPLPLIYDVSSVLSHIMTAVTVSTNDDDISVRCSPQRGDPKGGDEILMVIPTVDKRRAFTLRFDHPSIDSRSTFNMTFVDTKTVSFVSPECPVPLTRDNPSVQIPIVVTQNGVDIARVDFCYQSLDKCLYCNSNKRSLQHTDFEENDEVHFDDLTTNETDEQELDLTHVRNFITAVQRTRTEDQFSLLENAIQQGNIDLAVELIKQTQNYLERENEQGQTPLLLAAKFNQNRLIMAILKKQPEFAKHVDKRGNNLLHLLASVQQNKAKETIETVLLLLDDRMIEFLISGLNQTQQIPEQVAEQNGNFEYIDLFNRKINS